MSLEVFHLLIFGGEIIENWYNFFLKCLVEFSRKTICALLSFLECY